MPRKPSEQFLPVIRQGKIGEITIHQISDEELNLLARGGSNSVYLDFAIALLSVAVAFTFSLSTAVIESSRLFIVFTIITVVGYVAGSILIVVWCQTHRSMESVVKTIRDRLPPPEGVQEPLPPTE